MSDLMLKLVVALQTLRAREEGQGMAEYALILALVAVVVAAALSPLATAISSTLNDVAAKL